MDSEIFYYGEMCFSFIAVLQSECRCWYSEFIPQFDCQLVYCVNFSFYCVHKSIL